MGPIRPIRPIGRHPLPGFRKKVARNRATFVRYKIADNVGISRLAKGRKAEHTDVCEHFRSERNAEITRYVRFYLRYTLV